LGSPKEVPLAELEAKLEPPSTSDSV